MVDLTVVAAAVLKENNVSKRLFFLERKSSPNK